MQTRAFTFGVLGNQNHCILRATLKSLLAQGFVPSLVMEDEGSQKLRDKTAWYNKAYAQKRGDALPLVPELLSGIACKHYIVASVNDDSAMTSMKAHHVDLLILANTRVVKPSVLSVPRVTTMNAHPAYLPNTHPLHKPPTPQAAIRGAMPFIFALARNQPSAVTLHHALAALDQGDIVGSLPVRVRRGDTVTDIIATVVDTTASLWVQGVRNWDGCSSVGVKQEGDLTDERPVRAEECTAEVFDRAARLLSEQTYKWYCD